MIIYIIIYLIIFLLIIITLYYIYKNLLINKLKKFNKAIKNIKNVNLLYDDYYLHSKNKNKNKLIYNLGIIRENYYDNDYKFDIEQLELENNYKILIINTLDINFELEILKTFKKNKKKIYIFSTSNNIINTLKFKKQIKDYNFIINYCDIYDIYREYKNFKFDRIILRENLGNITNIKLFFKNIKSLLKNEKSYIYIKTFSFNNKIESKIIFNKQKKLIDYWNYNFSSYQSIINDLITLNYNVYYSKINLLNLLLLGNHKDILNNLILFFIHMNMNFNDLYDWFIIYSIELLFLKVY